MGHYLSKIGLLGSIVAQMGDPVNKSVPLSGRIPSRLGDVELLTKNIVILLQAKNIQICTAALRGVRP